MSTENSHLRKVMLVAEVEKFAQLKILVSVRIDVKDFVLASEKFLVADRSLQNFFFSIFTNNLGSGVCKGGCSSNCTASPKRF